MNGVAFLCFTRILGAGFLADMKNSCDCCLDLCLSSGLCFLGVLN